MANLCVSSMCNLSCRYCFAASTMRDAPRAARFVSLDDFDERLDFLERSGIREARLIGGEPTLHPRFTELVRRALARFDRLVVFTNGCIPARALDTLVAVAPERCVAMVNMTRYPGDGVAPSVQARRERSLRALGPRALAAITVVEPVLDYDWLPTLVRDAGCRPSVRVGLAQPSLSGANRFLHPTQHPRAGSALAHFAEVASEHGVRLELDCGFVRCMFSDADLDRLHELRADVGWHCSPVCDVDVDGRMIHCFPLAELPGVSSAAAAHLTAPDVRARLAEQVLAYDGVGIYRECADCTFHRRGECTGGCRAATALRFRRTEFRVAVPAVPTSLPVHLVPSEEAVHEPSICTS